MVQTVILRNSLDLRVGIFSEMLEKFENLLTIFLNSFSDRLVQQLVFSATILELQSGGKDQILATITLPGHPIFLLPALLYGSTLYISQCFIQKLHVAQATFSRQKVQTKM